MQDDKREKITTVFLNGIWFSPDGNIPNSVMSNYHKLMRMIKQSPYANHYQLLFWSDLDTLKGEIRKDFEETGIILKDYRRDTLHASQNEEKSVIGVKKLIEDFVSLGNKKDKLPYALASDLLRMLILLKEFPALHDNAVACYFDCNDIELKEIPNPERLFAVEGLACSVVRFLFAAINKKMAIMNNDVIIAPVTKENKSLLAHFFEVYYHNILFTQGRLKEIVPAYTRARNSMDVFSKKTAESIPFGLTHISTIFYFNESDLFLVDYARSNSPKISELVFQNAIDFFSFKRHVEEGQTWVPEKIITEEPTKECIPWEKEFKKKLSLSEKSVDSYLKDKKAKIYRLSQLYEEKYQNPQIAKTMVEAFDLLSHDNVLLDIYVDALKTWDEQGNARDHFDDSFGSQDIFSLAEGLKYLSERSLLNIATLTQLLSYPKGTGKYGWCKEFNKLKKNNKPIADLIFENVKKSPFFPELIEFASIICDSGITLNDEHIKILFHLQREEKKYLQELPIREFLISHMVRLCAINADTVNTEIFSIFLTIIDENKAIIQKKDFKSAEYQALDLMFEIIKKFSKESQRISKKPDRQDESYESLLKKIASDPAYREVLKALSLHYSKMSFKPSQSFFRARTDFFANKSIDDIASELLSHHALLMDSQPHGNQPQ